MTIPLDCFTHDAAGSVPLIALTPDTLQTWRGSAAEREAAWCDACGFTAKAGSVCLVPDDQGAIASVLTGIDLERVPLAVGALAGTLPAGSYHLPADLDTRLGALAALGFAMGAYAFTRYREAPPAGARLYLPQAAGTRQVSALARAVYLARDLINTPAGDMMPPQLAAAAETLSDEFGASCRSIVGEDLLREGFPAIHAVGRASAHAPRLLLIEWGREDAPGVTLIGKGVCFDSGGLDIKPSSGMRLMKKDMGGAAHALALGRLIMETDLDVRLQVLVPAVENAISGNAFRPGDVVPTRKGLNIEIDNTDAEGRVILSDALAFACESTPQVIVDFATLTGAARVAVGTELAAMFCNDDAVAEGIESAAAELHDPVCRLPLYQPYRKLIESKVADIANSSGVPYAGAITAALFLERFVATGIPWAHFDIMAWNTSARPAHPEGGEAMAIRAVFAWLESRFRA